MSFASLRTGGFASTVTRPAVALLVDVDRVRGDGLAGVRGLAGLDQTADLQATVPNRLGVFGAERPARHLGVPGRRRLVGSVVHRSARTPLRGRGPRPVSDQHRGTPPGASPPIRPAAISGSAPPMAAATPTCAGWASDPPARPGRARSARHQARSRS